LATTRKVAIGAQRIRTSPEGYYETPIPILVLFLGYVAYIYLQGGYRYPLLGEIRFEFILGAVLGVLSLLTLSQRRDLKASAVLRWMILLVVMALIMVPASVAPMFSWNVFIDRVVKFAMMTLFIIAFASSPRTMLVFVAVFMLVFLRMGYEGVISMSDGSLLWENQGVMRLHGPTPIYMHPNSFGGTQLGVIPFCLFLFLATRNWWLRSILVLEATAAVIVMIFTGSRTTYIALVAFAVYLAFAARSRTKAIGLLTLLVLVAAPFVPEQYIERAATIATQQDKEGASIDLRKEILSDALTIFLEHPMGVGVSAFPIVRNERFGRQQDTHNLYLEVGTNLGVLGLIIFVCLIVSLYRSMRRSEDDFLRQVERMRARAPPDAGAATSEAEVSAAKHLRHLRYLHAIARATIGFLVIRLLLGAFGHDLYEIYWWFMCGIAISMNNMAAAISARTEHFCAPIASSNPAR